MCFVFFVLTFHSDETLRDFKKAEYIDGESSAQCRRRQRLKSCETKKECRLTRQDVSGKTTDSTAMVFLSDWCNGKRSKRPQKPKGESQVVMAHQQNKAV